MLEYRISYQVLEGERERDRVMGEGRVVVTTKKGKRKRECGERVQVLKAA